jgi:threonine dehydrogenase-like Zn-dependent dehydrogenase
MKGVLLPGQRRVEIRDFDVPEPGPGQVRIRMKASSICGSDLRAIYREHLGEGPEAYQNVIAGHEPCGQIEKIGPGCKRFEAGDRVIIYHISGCGLCHDCRQGYMISCTSPLRAAYGWQRDGGHADYMLAEENTCVSLPDELSFEDGALVACGFGTAYEALRRAKVNGADSVLVAGMGPVGMGVGLLARALGARLVLGTDLSAERIRFAEEIGAINHGIHGDDDALAKIKGLTGGQGCSVTIDCSGSPRARHTALTATARWGRCLMVGEGNRIEFDVSALLIHKQIALMGSWVTSLAHMEELAERLAAWKLNPSITISHRFPLLEAEQAYKTADAGKSGKVCLIME